MALAIAMAALTGPVHAQENPAAPAPEEAAAATPIPVATIAYPGTVVQDRPFTVHYDGPLADGDQVRLSWLGTPLDAYITAAFVQADGAPIEFMAPAERGVYELRYWHDGAVLSRVPFRIEALTPTLEAPATVQQGGDIVVAWHADPIGGRTIEIAQPLAPLAAALATVDVIRSEPTVTLKAPARPGTYEVRLVDAPVSTDQPPELRDNDQTRILARATVVVAAADISLTVAGPVTAGQELTANWTGPGGTGDEIRLARPQMQTTDYLATIPARGEAVTFRAPYPPGGYEIRYWSAVLQDVIGVEAIDVQAPAASVTAPEAIAGGTTFAIDWTGPNAVGDRNRPHRRQRRDRPVVAPVPVWRSDRRRSAGHRGHLWPRLCRRQWQCGPGAAGNHRLAGDGEPFRAANGQYWSADRGHLERAGRAF